LDAIRTAAGAAKSASATDTFLGGDSMNAVDAIDAKDRLLLDLLYRNARLPLKTIAAKVGLARSSVRERVARLESRGVIRGYRADVEWPAALPVIQAYFTLRLKQTPSPALVRRLRERPELERCSSIGGEIDLILSARAESLLALNNLRDWLAEQAEVASVVTSVVLHEEFRR
jgi:DNA-binding Lrp family transcriptional regulator